MIVVLMGVAGSGKTTVGRVLARQLGWAFHDADDDHPAANVEKMRQGLPLTDDDRRPWLESLARRIDDARARGRKVIPIVAERLPATFVITPWKGGILSAGCQ